MTLTEEQIFLSGIADQVTLAAATVRFARDLMTPEQLAKFDFDFDKEIAAGFELAEKTRQMAKELESTE